MCPSSGEATVFMRHLLLVILFGRLSGMLLSYQTVVHLQHVEKRNNHTKKNCAPSWLHLQELYKNAASTKHKKDSNDICGMRKYRGRKQQQQQLQQ
jgi:hypothetical protein